MKIRNRPARPGNTRRLAPHANERDRTAGIRGQSSTTRKRPPWYGIGAPVEDTRVHDALGNRDHAAHSLRNRLGAHFPSRDPRAQPAGNGSAVLSRSRIVVVVYGLWHARLSPVPGSPPADSPSCTATVVETARDQDTKAAVESVARRPLFVSPRANLGFTPEAADLGIRRGSLYTPLLNPDTEVLAGTLAPAPPCSTRGRKSQWSARVSSGRTAPSITRRVARSRPCSAHSGISAASAGVTSAARSPSTARRRSSGPGRRGQRRLHAHPPCRARASRFLRRGLLDVHGGSRPLLPAQEAGWLTWYEPTSVALHVKRRIRRTPIPAARACVPRWDVAVL